MRIVGGEWRGRRLVAPAGRATRPTSDRVREAVFSTLEAMVVRGDLAPDPATAGVAAAAGSPGGGRLSGLTVLDLFAGSGAMGLEALSRGAAHCTFVDEHPAALRALRANIEALGCAPSRCRVAARDALRAAEADAREPNAYTLVLVDAPYAAYAAFERRFAALVAGLVSARGAVVVETAKGQPVGLPLHELGVRTYGGTQVTYLTRQERCPRT